MNNKSDYLILPADYPLITSYPRHANLLSILQNNDLILSWFLENYIGLQINKINDISNLKLDFHIGYDSVSILKYCPFITYTLFSRVQIKNIIDFIIHNIENEKMYFYFLVNRYYVSNYKFNFMKHHSNHDILIYGFDKKKRIFYGADFFSGKYSQEIITFEEIEEGYYKIATENDYDWLHGVVGIKINNNLVYDLNILKVKRNIKEYIEGSNLSIHNELLFGYMTDAYYSFGQNIYNELINYIKYFIKIKVEKVDVKHFHILTDHKRVISLLVKYLQNENYLDNDFYYINISNELIDTSLILRNFILKYNMKRDLNILFRCTEYIHQIKNMEGILFNKLLLNIKERKSLSISKYINSSNAIFIEEDFNTKGDWKTKYGNEGYNLCCLEKLVSNCVIINIHYNYRYCNSNNTLDNRALLSENENIRVSASYVSLPNESIDIEVVNNEDVLKSISIYFLDWYRSDAKLCLEVVRVDTDEILHTLNIKNCEEGIYVSYNIAGHIIFRIKSLLENGVAFFSGIFINN